MKNMYETMSEVARQKAAHSIMGYDLTPTKPSFFIKWNKATGQFKIVPKMNALTIVDAGPLDKPVSLISTMASPGGMWLSIWISTTSHRRFSIGLRGACREYCSDVTPITVSPCSFAVNAISTGTALTPLFEKMINTSLSSGL